MQICASDLSLDEAQAFGLIRCVMEVGKFCVVLSRVCGGHAMQSASKTCLLFVFVNY